MKDDSDEHNLHPVVHYTHSNGVYQALTTSNPAAHSVRGKRMQDVAGKAHLLLELIDSSIASVALNSHINVSLDQSVVLAAM